MPRILWFNAPQVAWNTAGLGQVLFMVSEEWI